LPLPFLKLIFEFHSGGPYKSKLGLDAAANGIMHPLAGASLLHEKGNLNA
jgi:hypothetical protein